MNNTIKIKDAIIKDNLIYDSDTKEFIGKIGNDKIIYSLSWLCNSGIDWYYEGDVR